MPGPDYPVVLECSDCDQDVTVRRFATHDTHHAPDSLEALRQVLQNRGWVRSETDRLLFCPRCAGEDALLPEVSPSAPPRLKLKVAWQAGQRVTVVLADGTAYQDRVIADAVHVRTAEFAIWKFKLQTPGGTVKLWASELESVEILE